MSHQFINKLRTLSHLVIANRELLHQSGTTSGGQKGSIGQLPLSIMAISFADFIANSVRKESTIL